MSDNTGIADKYENFCKAIDNQGFEESKTS